MRETADIIGEVAAVCMERLGRREGAWNGVRAVRGGTNAVIVQPGAVVLAAVPEWGQFGVVHALFGLAKAQLRAMVCDGRVIAKKLDPDARNSTTLYRIADVRAAMDGLADYREWMENAKGRAASGSADGNGKEVAA